MKMSSHLKAELAATCSTLGRFHKGEYLIEPECVESVKDIVRYLKRDNEAHEIRRYLGESKVLQSDLIHIIKSCPKENSDLFNVTLRLLVNLTSPTILIYGEEVPTDKIGRNVYLSLVGILQDYKISFCDVEFWNKICLTLTELFGIDSSERSDDDGIRIERILMLLRNVLQVPADIEWEKRPENDLSVHDKVLWALRQSQILELLLLISSKKNEEQYYLSLLEISSLIFREQNPKVLARSDERGSNADKKEETNDLIVMRASEKKTRNKYLNLRNFNATYVIEGVKSLSNNDVVCHKSLTKANEIELNNQGKKQARIRRNRIPAESERAERRSTFAIRLFLKEFCSKFLNGSFNHLMRFVKNRLDSGKSLANDQTYYFWALSFFLDFASASNSNVDLVKSLLSSESFHFVVTSMDNAFEHLVADKKKTNDWVRRIHLILKAYRSLLETLLWIDSSKNPLTRSISREIKSQIFYVAEYREMILHVLLLYDPAKFSLSYLRDLIETTHLFMKLLEEFSKEKKLVVQKIKKKKLSRKKSATTEEKVSSPKTKWQMIEKAAYDILSNVNTFPEIPPFDAALDIPIDHQKGLAMKKIQKLIHAGELEIAIGLLRSARQVWPENDCFGADGMSVEDEMMALQEICLADLKNIHGEKSDEDPSFVDSDSDEKKPQDLELESRVQVVEQDFDIMDYKKRLVNKKIIEGCGILLKNYKKNSHHTNHCVIKLLHRIGWECCMPAMLFQASMFWTLLKIMQDRSGNFEEINTFTVNLLRQFRKLATRNPFAFVELLFWKDHNVALGVQHGYESYSGTSATGKRSKSKKKKEQFSWDEEEWDTKGKEKEENDAELAEVNNLGMLFKKQDVDSENEKNHLEEEKGERILKEKSSKIIEKVDDYSPNETSLHLGEKMKNFKSENYKSLPDVFFSSGCESEDGDDGDSGNEKRSRKIAKFICNRKNKEVKKEEYQSNRSSIKKKVETFHKNQRKFLEGSRADGKFEKSHEWNRAERRLPDRPKSTTPENQSEGVKSLKCKTKSKIVFYSGGDDEKGDKSENSEKASTAEMFRSVENYMADATEPRFLSETEVLKEDQLKSTKSLLEVSTRRNDDGQSLAKRSREAKSSFEDTDESESSRPKRIRPVSPDWNVEMVESDDERPIFANRGRKKKRLALIDSDSDSDEAKI